MLGAVWPTALSRNFIAFYSHKRDESHEPEAIDELPQFINVFKGDMSLIGPRPGLPREVALYDERAVRRLTVKPGCGGAWQVSGRSDVGFERMVELDLDYIDGRSVSQDFDLVLGTLRAMFDGKGAA